MPASRSRRKAPRTPPSPPGPAHPPLPHPLRARKAADRLPDPTPPEHQPRRRANGGHRPDRQAGATASSAGRGRRASDTPSRRGDPASAVCLCSTEKTQQRRPHPAPPSNGCAAPSTPRRCAARRVLDRGPCPSQDPGPPPLPRPDPSGPRHPRGDPDPTPDWPLQQVQHRHRSGSPSTGATSNRHNKPGVSRWGQIKPSQPTVPSSQVGPDQTGAKSAVRASPGLVPNIRSPAIRLRPVDRRSALWSRAGAKGGALQFHEGRRKATRRALALRQSSEPSRPFPLGSSTTNERPGCDQQRELPLLLHARRVREERVSESPACQPCFCISSLQDVTMPAKTGRRSKGDRDAFAIRPMRPVGDRIRENAAALGITYNDYVTGILARAVGMPEYAPLELTTAQLHLDERMTA